MSKIYTLRSFVDSRSVGTVVDEVARALTDAGFVCDRILLEEEGLIIRKMNSRGPTSLTPL
jgi:hypothetical protein